MKELDVESGVRIYSGTKDDVIDAMNLIGQDVYMSDYANFEEYYKLRLIGIRFVEGDPFVFVGSDYDCDGTTIIYKYFILEKNAKFKVEKEKELRPFKDIEEFFNETGLSLGEVIHYRKKDNIARDYVSIISSYTNDGYILIGGVYRSLVEFFNYYEYYDSDNSEWKPFGVEE